MTSVVPQDQSFCSQYLLDDSSDDEDDDLLQYSAFSKSPAPKAAPLPSDDTPVIIKERSANDDDDDNNDETNIQQRAERLANIADLWLVKDVTDSSMLRWYRPSKGCKDFPCCIRTNHEEASGLSIKISKSKPILIKHLGRKAPSTGKMEAVSESRLSPVTDVWDEEKMKNYLQHLATTQPFRDSESSKLNLAVEEMFLKRLLQQVVENQQTQEEPVKEEISEATEEAQTSPIVSQETPPPKSAKRNKKIRSSSDGLEVPIARGQSRPQVQIRAGDLIKYYEPCSHTRIDSLRQAFVIEAYPRPHEIALHLSNGQYLPRDVQVKLLRKRKNGKLVDAENQHFVCLDECKVTKINNGKYDHLRDTRMDDLIKDMKDTTRQVEEEVFGQPEKRALANASSPRSKRRTTKR